MRMQKLCRTVRKKEREGEPARGDSNSRAWTREEDGDFWDTHAGPCETSEGTDEGKRTVRIDSGPFCARVMRVRQECGRDI